MNMVTFIDIPNWLVYLEVISKALLYTGIGFGLIVYFMIRGIEYVKGV